MLNTKDLKEENLKLIKIMVEYCLENCLEFSYVTNIQLNDDQVLELSKFVNEES